MLRSGYRQVVPQKTVRPLRRTSSNKEVPQRHRMGLPRLSIVCSKLLRFLHYNRFHVADSRGNNIGIIDRNTNSRRNKMPVIYDRLTFRLSLVEGRFRPQGFWWSMSSICQRPHSHLICYVHGLCRPKPLISFSRSSTVFSVLDSARDSTSLILGILAFEWERFTTGFLFL